MPKEDTPRIEAWKMILNQVEALQAKLSELGCQAAVDHYSTDDGIAGLQGAEFVSGSGDRVTLEGHDFGDMPDMIALKQHSQGDEVWTHSGDGTATMRDAAMQIFDNIVEYVYATSGPDAVIDGFDLCLHSAGDIEVDVTSDASRPWSPPSATNSLKQLGSWLDRERDRLSYEVTDRFTELVKGIVADLEDEYQDLGLTVMSGLDTINFRLNYKGSRQRFDRLRFEEVEDEFPGLFEKLEEIEDAYKKLDIRITATDFAPIRVDLEHERDDTPEP